MLSDRQIRDNVRRLWQLRIVASTFHCYRQARYSSHRRSIASTQSLYNPLGISLCLGIGQYRMHSFENDTEKKPDVSQPSSGDEETQPTATLGTVTELHDLTMLGYKPELRRNRSMFTLLFQSLAIAAVSATHHHRVSSIIPADRHDRYPTASAGPSFLRYTAEVGVH